MTARLLPIPMRRLLLLLLPMACATAADFIPTPDEAMGFSMQDDPRPWQQAYTNGSKNGFIMEFVLKGDNIDSWNELVAQQIVFTKAPLKPYFEAWKAGMQKADPAIKIEIENSTADSILARYNSAAAHEMALRRFIQGRDGIYSLQYAVRPKLANKDILATWKKILLGAKLVPNPEKK